MKIPKQQRGMKVQVYHDTAADTPDAGVQFMHCAQCLAEWRDGHAPGESPASYARQQVALTADGIQVRCTRHDLNITTMHLRAVLS